MLEPWLDLPGQARTAPYIGDEKGHVTWKNQLEINMTLINQSEIRINDGKISQTNNFGLKPNNFGLFVAETKQLNYKMNDN